MLRVELSARPTQPVHGRWKRIMNRSSWHRTWQNSRATTLGVTDTDAALPPINLAHPKGMESNKLKRERWVLNNAAQKNTFGLPWQSLTARSPSGKAKQRKQQYGNTFLLYLSSYVHRLHPSSLRSVYTVPAVLSIHGDEGLSIHSSSTKILSPCRFPFPWYWHTWFRGKKVLDEDMTTIFEFWLYLNYVDPHESFYVFG